MKLFALLFLAIFVASCSKAGHEAEISPPSPVPEVPTSVSEETNPNNKPEGWKIPLNGRVLSRQTVELDGPQGKERVELTRRDVPEDTKLTIPYFGGRTDYMVRVQYGEELAREGQFPYAYQLTVTEVCERPQDCRPVSWIIRVRDEDGDKIFETYGGTILPPAWAK
jgi:hypothetical protein